jgi:hypothetical protein
MEVLVVLHQNRAQVPLGSLSRFVVEGGHNDAKGQLLVLVNVVFVSVVLLFFICQGGGSSEILTHHVPPLLHPFYVFLGQVAVLVVEVGVFLDVFENIVVLHVLPDALLSSLSVGFALVGLRVLHVPFGILLLVYILSSLFKPLLHLLDLLRVCF